MNVPHCYLCGRPLRGPTSRDHCPPKGLFPKKLGYNFDRLLTFPVHKRCNASYARDEEYFQATMMPLGQGSVAGDAILKEFFEGTRRKGRKMELARKIYREFEERPSGLYLLPGRVLKRQEGKRITRVAWKIVRGLHFFHHGSILQKDHSRVVCREKAPDEEPSELLHAMAGRPDDETHGRYPGVFDYRFQVKESEYLNCWVFLLWDKIVLEVLFHNPWSCGCGDCTADLAEIKNRMGGDQPPIRTQSNSR